MNWYMYMTFDKGKLWQTKLWINGCKNKQIVQSRAQFWHYYHPPSGSDLTTTTTSPNPVIMANGQAVHIQGWIQDFHRRGHQPSSGGCQHIIFTKFSEKLHEIEKILVRRGGTCWEHPLRSATDILLDVSWSILAAGTFEKKMFRAYTIDFMQFSGEFDKIVCWCQVPPWGHTPPYTHFPS